jgi:hypothetical protein
MANSKPSRNAKALRNAPVYRAFSPKITHSIPRRPILKGQVCELRAVGKQVHVIQRDAIRESPPSPPDPHEDSGSDDFEE